jgi:GntR family transcriptional regulator/MocR family aminotransferase
MRITLDREAGTPVNRQIADRLREEVAAGHLAPGDRLPAIRDLARELGVNRDTVALAYERLAAQGFVESTVGRGTFVAAIPGGAAPELVEPPVSPLVERLLDFERARPHFGEAGGAVAMHALVPESSLYPADAFRRALNRVLGENGPDLLLYGDPQGHPALREVLAERLGRAGIEVQADDVVLCHGASQGISLAVRLFTAPGDAVAVEEPTYNNVLATLFSLGIKPIPVPMTERGPDLDALERALARPEVKLLYTIPTFHNPMGISTPLAHRRGLLAIAARHATPVVEDAFEMDLRYAGRPVPPLAALDTRGLVVHLFSFSKSLFPGTRVGSIVARGRAVEALLALKRAADLSDAMPLQAALAEFVRSGAYDRHLAGLRRVLESRRDALLGALADDMPPGTRWTEPQGGYQVWVELPGGIDTAALLADAMRAGVLFAPGYQFHCDGRPSSALRLTVAMADEGAIERGVATLGRLVRERLAAAPRLGDTASVHV